MDDDADGGPPPADEDAPEAEPDRGPEEPDSGVESADGDELAGPDAGDDGEESDFDAAFRDAFDADEDAAESDGESGADDGDRADDDSDGDADGPLSKPDLPEDAGPDGEDDQEGAATQEGELLDPDEYGPEPADEDETGGLSAQESIEQYGPTPLDPEQYGPERPSIDPDAAAAAPVDAADGGTVDAAEAAAIDSHSTEVDHPDNLVDPSLQQGPPDDEEMPLAVHIEEMVKRLFVVVAVAGLVSVAVFPFGEQVIDFLWYSVLPGGDVAQPRVYHPLALVLTQLTVASLAGLIVALPVAVYQTYRFMRPGLYPNERRYYLAAVPTSLVLAFVGVTFAYFVVLPTIFTYFLYYSRDVTTIAFALSDTFNLILLLMGYLAVVFQIPLFIMLAIMMGLVTRRWMEQRRLYFWGAFLGISFLFSPDPTGLAPFIVAVTMVVLFEGTLVLLRWTGN